MPEARYRKVFDVSRPPRKRPSPLVVPVPEGGFGEGEIYEYTKRIELAVNVALTTGRPLLVTGEPGSGKSSLARNVAHRLKWRYYERVITSKDTAEDLQWSFDAIRRLGDARIEGGLRPREEYIEPGVLWWVFDPDSARLRGAAELAEERRPEDPGIVEGRDRYRAVLLLDEIDKADPDVPNDLLVALGAQRFSIRDLDRPPITPKANPLIVITSNGERELPRAFQRRCIHLEVHPPKDLTPIGRRHFPEADPALLERVQGMHGELADLAATKNLRAPSVAEYLDAVRASLGLRTAEESTDFERVMRAVLWKGPEENEEGER
jgi:MoxR-like ATPase